MSVAFFARLDQDIASLDVGNAIKFRADVNNGRAYNSSTGTFTANQGGMYYFGFTVGQRTANQADPPVSVYLQINGSMQKAGVVTDSPKPSDPVKISQGSNHAIVEMNAGDTAEITVYKIPAKCIAGDGFSTFSGHLL